MRIFQKILCPVDFSDYSVLALRYATALAREYEAQLFVYHSVPDLEQVLTYLEGNYSSTVCDMLFSNAKDKLEQFVAKVVPEAGEAMQKIGAGSPSEAILKVSQEEGVDLIVMGTHGHTGYYRFLLGSVTNKVLHKCATPVLVVCKPSHHFIQPDSEHPVDIKRILCAIDFEPNTERMKDLALSLARTYQSEMLFLHVLTNGGHADLDERKEQVLLKMKELFHPEQEDWCKVEFVVEAGDPAEAITKVTKRHDIDLVIMGHHTRKPIDELFLGSVTKRVVPDSACPVLVVRSQADLVFS